MNTAEFTGFPLMYYFNATYLIVQITSGAEISANQNFQTSIMSMNTTAARACVFVWTDAERRLSI